MREELRALRLEVEHANSVNFERLRHDVPARVRDALTARPATPDILAAAAEVVRIGGVLGHAFERYGALASQAAEVEHDRQAMLDAIDGLQRLLAELEPGTDAEVIPLPPHP